MIVISLAFAIISRNARANSFRCEALFDQESELQSALKNWPESLAPKVSELALAERQMLAGTESIYLVGQLAIDPAQNSYKPIVVHLKIENQFGEFNKDGNLAQLEILWSHERVAAQLNQGDHILASPSGDSLVEIYSFKVNNQILEVKLFFTGSKSSTLRVSGDRVRRGMNWKLVRANIQAV